MKERKKKERKEERKKKRKKKRKKEGKKTSVATTFKSRNLKIDFFYGNGLHLGGKVLEILHLDAETEA